MLSIAFAMSFNLRMVMFTGVPQTSDGSQVILISCMDPCLREQQLLCLRECQLTQMQDAFGISAINTK